MKRFLVVIVSVGLIFTSFVFTSPVYAYYTYMPASIVVGQPGFTSTTTGTDSKSVNQTYGASSDGTRLYVTDRNGGRVLIFNSIPIRNYQSADVILTGTGSSTFGQPGKVFAANNKLFVVDGNGNRILIWNSIPTSNTAADVVLLKTSFSDTTNTTTQTTGAIGGNGDVWSDGTRLFVAAFADNRVLIWNTIPTVSGTPADIVLGQQNFNVHAANDQNGDGVTDSASASTLSGPTGVSYDGQRLYVSDIFNGRVLIWNSLPTSNAQPADVVVGKPDMSTLGTGGVTATNISQARKAVSDGTRLFVADADFRLLVWNQIPTSNGLPADMVLGQPDFTSNIDALNDREVGRLKDVSVIPGRLIVAQSSRSRVVIFDDVNRYPEVNIGIPTTSPVSSSLLRMTGSAHVDGPYQISSVEYSINGGGTFGAQATDGYLNSGKEDFYFDFDPKANYYTGDGYTVKVKAITNNVANVDRLFYFTPFVFNTISDSTNLSPSFSFSVNKGRIQDIKDNLSNFRVLVKKDGEKEYKTYIDNVPVDFGAYKDSLANLQRNYYLNSTLTGVGIYEDTLKKVEYSDLNTKFKVTSKTTKLTPGRYKVKIQALDGSGHTEDSNEISLNILKRTIPITVTTSTPTPTYNIQNTTPIPGPTPTPQLTPTPEPKTCFLFWCW